MRGFHAVPSSRRRELRKLVELSLRTVSDFERPWRRGPPTWVNERRHVDHALLAAPNHLEARVLVPDEEANERRLFRHDDVPPHDHDVRPSAPPVRLVSA